MSTTNTSKYAPECPCCGSIRTKPINKGRADSGHPVRSVRCLTCREANCVECADTHHRFATAEVSLPHGVTMEQLDSDLRDRKRQWWREHNGYRGGTSGKRAKSRYSLHVGLTVYDHKERHSTRAEPVHLDPGDTGLLRILQAEGRQFVLPDEDYVPPAPHSPSPVPDSKRGLHGTTATCSGCGDAIHRDDRGFWRHIAEREAAA